MRDLLLHATAQALDDLDVAMCAFDSHDRVLVWNRSFLRFFPEHEAAISVGEHYAENLRRFYAGQLQVCEQHLLERYVAAGVERHRSQHRPYEFEVRGQRLRVSCVDLARLGRLRVWRKVSAVGSGTASSEGGPVFGDKALLLLERVADGVLVVDAEDRILWANDAFLELYGLASLHDIEGSRFEDVYSGCWEHDPEAADHLQGLETLRVNRRYIGAPHEIALPGSRWMRVVEQPRFDASGRGCFMHGDITASKRREQSLLEARQQARESEARYRLLAEYSSDITASLVNGVFSYVSPAVSAVLGWTPEELLGRHFSAFCHADDRSQLVEAFKAGRHNPETDYQFRALARDGTPVWVEARARKSDQPAEGGHAALVVNIRNIALRKALEDELAAARRQLEALATTDSLTGLANRRRFDEGLRLEVRRARRQRLPLSLVLLDIDHFKRLNDSQGHQAGDAVLVLLGRLLREAAHRAGDLAARFGGDELALLLPNTPAPAAVEAVQALMQRFLAQQQPQELQQPGPEAAAAVTLSAGVACLDFAQATAPTDTAEQLLRSADEALYAAKGAGRNRVFSAQR